MGHVVVGVDGSKNARGALAFAVEAARLRGARLRVVYVQDVSRLRAGGSRFDGLDVGFQSAEGYQAIVERNEAEREELENQLRQHADQLLEQVVRDADTEGVEIEQVVLFDRRPARRLVELVNEDRDEVDLLVVGARGRGELTNRLLGSVSQACVSHARVPVTIVPPRDR